MITQLITQTADFWKTQFQVTDTAIEALYNLIVESGEPQSIDAVGIFLVEHIVEEETRKARSDIEQGKSYSPHEDYAINDKIVFPQLSFALGTVVNKRPGHNPVDGDFTILEVEFTEQDGLLVDFAANLKTPHALLRPDDKDVTKDKSSSIQKIYGKFQHIIRSKVEVTLRQHDDFVEFNRTWFLKDFLVEVQDGLLNIVDAAIDINASPLNVDTLIEQIDLQGNGQITEATRFSVNYRLNNDDRFENVGTDEMALWYASRLKPAWVLRPPSRLREGEFSFDIGQLNNEQRALLAEIDDEATPIEYAKPVDTQAKTVTFVVNYHHRRLGTLPALPVMHYLLPSTDDRVIALELIDGRTGDIMLCWYVSQYNYILGVADWYQKYNLPVGAVITLTGTDNPLKLVVDFIPQRTQQEHVRVATVRNDQLVFEMRKRRLSCKYDELMIIGEEGSESIDVLWDKVKKNNLSIYDLLGQILPELMKLTSQGAVHIKTIYSAINVLKRCSPGLLMQELVKHDKFVSMGHGYWTFRSSKTR